jgi:IclR family pca regulon transcriptional regulator
MSNIDDDRQTKSQPHLRMAKPKSKQTPQKEVEGERTETMKSLRAALRVLSEFEGNQRDFGVLELAERCGLSKSRVSKVLDAFAESGLLLQDPETRRYSVAVRMYTIGSRYLVHDRLCGAAIPVMRDLVNRTGHSVRLSIPDGDRVLYLLGLEGQLFVDTAWRSGHPVPAFASSAGRVIMAFMEPEWTARMLSRPMQALTRQTITDRAKIEKILKQVRATGYAKQVDETSEGLGLISVPVFGANRRIIGALGIAFPAHIDLSKDEAQLVDMLHEAARAVSQRMGCDVYPYGAAVVPFPRAMVSSRGR